MLTPTQTKKYFETQSGEAEPLSPLEYEKSLLTPEKKEPIIIAPGLANDAIKKADETKARLTPDEYLEQGGALKDGQIPKKEEPTITPTGREINPITLLNEVGQEVTFDNPDINIQNIQRYLDQGYEVKSGSLPSGVSVGGQADPLQDEINRSTQEINEAKAVYDNAVNELRNLDVKNDPRFQAISAGITNVWEQRIREMETANTSRQAKLQQTGIRLGSRFVSMGTSFGGVISQEERDGLQRISSLESQKQSELANAETAFLSEEWGKYVYFVEEAKQRYAEEIEELEKLNALSIEQNKRQATEQNKTLVDDAVYNVLSTGVMDTASVYAQLRNQGIETTAKDVKSIIASFVPEPTPADKQITNAYEFGKDDVGKLIASGLSGTDIQATQDILNQYGLYGGVPELDNQSLSEFINPQQLKTIKDILYPQTPKDVSGSSVVGDYSFHTQSIRLGHMLFGTGRAFGEGDKKTAQEITKSFLTSTGMPMEEFMTTGIYQLADEYQGFIFKDETNRPLAEGLRNTLLNFDAEEGLSTYNMNGIARLINAEDLFGAVKKVEEAGIAKLIEQRGAANVWLEADVIFIQEKFDEINDLLGVGWMDDIGAFGEGRVHLWFVQKFGIGGEGARIRAKVTNTIADMVNRRAGSAITETEWERLIAPNVPSIDDSGTVFRQKLTELYDDVLTKHNAGRKSINMPELTKQNIKYPETRISLYSGSSDPNPLNIQTDEANPLELNI